MKTATASIITTCLFIFYFNFASEFNLPYPKSKSIISDQQEHPTINGLQLNNGKKWVVDANMMVHIRNMESVVNAFVKENRTDYSALANKLQSNINLLTSNCTMKGKAHDELHKWLIPYIGLVKDFSKAGNDKESALQLNTIRESFTVFNTYFE